MKLINSEKINKNLAIRIIFSLFVLLFLVFLGICIYTMVIVPQQISSSIRKEMIEFYAPTAINEEEDAILLTLMEKPNEELLEISYAYLLA